MRLQAESEGAFYAAEVVTVSGAKAKTKAPVKVRFVGYTAASDEWVGGDRIRSKALRIGAKSIRESNAKAKSRQIFMSGQHTTTAWKACLSWLGETSIGEDMEFRVSACPFNFPDLPEGDVQMYSLGTLFWHICIQFVCLKVSNI